MVHLDAHGLIESAILIWLASLLAMPIKLPTNLLMSYLINYLPTYLPSAYLCPTCLLLFIYYL
jgi:hypothetical protein